MDVIGREYLRDGAEAEMTIISGTDGQFVTQIKGQAFNPKGASYFAVGSFHVWPDQGIVWVNLGRTGMASVQAAGGATMAVERVQSVSIRPTRVQA